MKRCLKDAFKDGDMMRLIGAALHYDAMLEKYFASSNAPDKGQQPSQEAGLMPLRRDAHGLLRMTGWRPEAADA